MQQRKRKCSTLFKRVKERSVQMAVEKVEEWRKLFENGKYDNSGNLKKLTLQQAAEEVGIPKKTLEDYHQLIKKAKEIYPIEQLYDQKMGYLRKLIKQKQKFKQNSIEIESEDENEYDSDDDEDGQFQTQQKDFDIERYFALDDDLHYYDQNSLVMIVQIPQIIEISQKETYNFKKYTENYDSNQETEDEDF
ncbi:unnamed protein product [Paramecium sonneborni]|uniref:Uncharacterized protein n=1 Tax=Paramecium sonneborni TaxID=65129 RepID=A0A8S1LWF4_9CILI|nr:unnamed protein product [Paramecium sonneborni]